MYVYFELFNNFLLITYKQSGNENFYKEKFI